ncbi:hypothetical protein D910_02853 [Dendroctonus ponderosae]|uniref:RRM domain-containing protein n=1 Tax=Dendroctonus ponderosae TaxID=77166 RepID=U4TV57_DENPD|nr:hypothetical protein D910_02853 [Dendroctonus ponderosae]
MLRFRAKSAADPEVDPKDKKKERGRDRKKRSNSGSTSSDDSRSRSSPKKLKQRSKSQSKDGKEKVKDTKEKRGEKTDVKKDEKEKDRKGSPAKDRERTDRDKDGKDARNRSRSPRKRRKRSPTPRPTKIHIGHLTRTVNKDHIVEIFGTYGTIKHVEFPKDRNHSNLGSGYCYVEYSNPDEAENAMKHMDGGQTTHAKTISAFTTQTTKLSSIFSKVPQTLPTETNEKPTKKAPGAFAQPTG